MKLRDKYGWPVTHFRGRPIVNFIRYLIHTNIRQTWRLRNSVQQSITSGDVTCAPCTPQPADAEGAGPTT